MFSGIVETKSKLKMFLLSNGGAKLVIQNPFPISELKIGESICVNGVCLTIETFSSDDLVFAIGIETLRVTNWEQTLFEESSLNLERSLKFGDRVHGHLVSGHVESMGRVLEVTKIGESTILKIFFPKILKPFLWDKCSVAINGVSLTVNKIFDTSTLEVCLIPETLRRTNLVDLKNDDLVTIETDYLSKAIYNAQKFNNQLKETHEFNTRIN